LFSLPAASIEWCYAQAYCAWQGKHLCGKIGGGESLPRNWQQVNLKNQWDYACVNGALGSEYGYGQPYDAGACNAEGDAAAPVGSYPGCHGVVPPFTGIFDMSGNVAELDDMASEHAPDPNREIGAHGGAWAMGGAASTCGSYFGFGPYVGFDNVGFRCCAEVSP
jgi:sulfatase modifying factor 1